MVQPLNRNQKKKLPASAKQRRRRIPWFIALVGVAASFWAFIEIHRNQETRIQNEFERRAQTIANLMQGTLRAREEALRTLRELFHASDAVTRDEFERAANDLIRRHPGLQSLKWAPRVPFEQQAKFEETARADGRPDFKIFEATATRAPSATETPKDCFPVFFSTPLDRAPRSLGFDLASSPAWADFQAATLDGDLRASGPVAFVAGETDSDSYVMELPVYHDSVPPSQLERKNLLSGFVLGVFKPSAVLESLVAQVPHLGLDVLLVDRVSLTELRVLHFCPSRMGSDEQAPPKIDDLIQGPHHFEIISIGGRTWELWFRPATEWLTNQRTYFEYVIAVFGLLLTAVLAFYIRVVVRQTNAVESLVAQRTTELTATQQELHDDIRRRIETERALKASEERYRALVSQSSDAIWRLELPQPVSVSLPLNAQIQRILTTGLIAECNELTAQMHGQKYAGEILGQHLAFLSPRATQQHEALLRAFVRSGYRLTEHESSDTRPGGETRIFVHNLIGVLEDDHLARIWVTERELTHQRLLEKERQAFERRLGETQRLESLGVLAGGIAHDFNNLLTGIMGHASLGRSAILANSPLQTHFEQIESASLSAANLCQQMLAYAGKGRFVVKPHNLSLLISRTAHLLQISVSKHAELRFHLAEDLPSVQADATQIQQIVMNLVLNASEAISQRSGLITVTTGFVQPDTTTFANCTYAPEKLAPAYVFIEVRDNGCGMSPDVSARIFEPFFTTKFTGRGLGLPAALGIVRGHAGALRVESDMGIGSTFTLFLPAMEPQPEKEKSLNLTHTPWHAEGTILVIDDEEPVRSVAERMAQALGFSALSAANGEQGLQLFKLYRTGIKVVLLDFSMPGLTSEETLARLRALDASVRIVVMSGYNQPELPSTNGKPPVFLSKPFSTAQFQAAIRQAIVHG